MKNLTRKNVFIFIVSILVCCTVIISSRILVDSNSPKITIKDNNFRFSCETRYEDLLNNANADDVDLKDFFIEENDLNEITELKVVTYVAIDNSGNVSKKVLQLNINPDITNYNVFLKKELIVQRDEVVNFNDYFGLKNKCGWVKEDKFLISGYDLNETGVYEVVVSSSNADSLTLEMEVIDNRIPIIKLKNSEITIYDDEEYDFEDNIDEIIDDIDSYKELMKNVVIEKNDLNDSQYTVIYRVIDSDDNEGLATLIVNLKERPVVANQSSQEESSIDYNETNADTNESQSESDYVEESNYINESYEDNFIEE